MSCSCAFYTFPLFGAPLRPLQECPFTLRLVNSIFYKTQSPVDLILNTCLSSYSTLVQGLAEVERPGMKSSPVQLYGMSKAGSGERKTTVVKLVTKPILEFQEVEMEEYSKLFKTYEMEVHYYDTKLKALKSEIDKRQRAGKSDDHLRQQLLDLASCEPRKPRNPTLLFENTTTEALAFNLSEGAGIATLLSDEGGTILNGKQRLDLPMLNKAWDSESIILHRKSSASFTIKPRLTISLGIQPKGLEKFMKNHGSEALGIGFLARFVFCDPVSTQGSRFISPTYSGDVPFYDQYLDKANELLARFKRHVSDENLEREIIRFSPEATDLWVRVFNHVEENLRPGGRFERAKDHGSKLCENIARIAALLTYIELGGGHLIPVGVLQEAINIAFYFSDAFVRNFCALPAHSGEREHRFRSNLNT